MKTSARKIVLPRLMVTEIAQEDDKNAIKISLSLNGQDDIYYIKPKYLDTFGRGSNKKENRIKSQFNLFPLVIDAHGVPWAEANVYLLSRIEDSMSVRMATFSSIADDLAAYRRFLDEEQVNWIQFSAHKLKRPTYRYSRYLRLLLATGEIASSTASRRMSSVIAFYSWLRMENVLIPDFPPWNASDRYIEFIDSKGFKVGKKVVTTDVSIKTPKQIDPYVEYIDDGGKLRPLNNEEQNWVISALGALGNTEMTLIHLFSLLTGARIQTALTLRVKHVLKEVDGTTVREVRLPVGPGTGIDTKNDKQHVLIIPTWFYQRLRIYVYSERAIRRRAKSILGNSEDQYLFLSVRGAPLYEAKSYSLVFNDENNIRHSKVGQGVRQYIKERVIPYIHNNFNPRFHYKFHDIRATYGMNLTDYQLYRVSKKEITLHQAREFVKTRMSHSSSATTDLYLQFRTNQKMMDWVSEGYENHLKNLSNQALVGIL